MNMSESALHGTEALLRAHWQDRYAGVRQQSESLCAPLQVEDYVIQTMPNVSPPKWHLAHVTWFFETFLLKPYLPGYREYAPEFVYLFNSYYQTVGEPYPRAKRGLLSRPGVEEVYRYRHHVNRAMQELIAGAPEGEVWDEVMTRLMLGVQHEQQHQELLLTDIKHIFAMNPMRPVYAAASGLAGKSEEVNGELPPAGWMSCDGGVQQIGYEGDEFHFDNETPRHAVLLQNYALASRLVTNGEYLEFIEQGGYARPELWLADGWNTVRQERWQAPLYWQEQQGQWLVMTLSGMQPLNPDEPVCHVSFYEADAYARWAGARLPTEAELELALADAPTEGNFMEAGYFHPQRAEEGRNQLYGDVWEWTQSPYVPYPGFRPLPGALGEYNGKFMCNQIVLRGGSCATPQSQIRASYRNFFMPSDRWQFTGIRLASLQG
jgi:ergothioneine biosynthesis protein EgtB